MQWELAVAAFVGFTVSTRCQTWVLNRFINKVVKPDMRLRPTEEVSQLTRMDMAGEVKLLEIANGLLAAILVVLVLK